LRIHDLKCDEVAFTRIANGHKTAEFRKDDRGYAEGDLLLLRAYASEAYLDLPPVLVRITHVDHGGTWGIPDGFVIMSIQRVVLQDHVGSAWPSLERPAPPPGRPS
jgi:hypothetical protein